jgi:hypothetical protein
MIIGKADSIDLISASIPFGSLKALALAPRAQGYKCSFLLVPALI